MALPVEIQNCELKGFKLRAEADRTAEQRQALIFCLPFSPMAVLLIITMIRFIAFYF